MIDLKDNKLLIGICLGSVSSLLVAVLAGTILFTTLKPEPIELPKPYVTAEQVVDAGYGHFYLDEYKNKQFRLYDIDSVCKRHKETRVEERKEKVKGFFSKCWSNLKKPFSLRLKYKE